MLRKGKNPRKGISDLLLPLKSKPVQNEHLGGQEDSGNFALVECNTQEIQGASPIHRGASDIEREASDGGIHENTEIISEVGSGDA